MSRVAKALALVAFTACRTGPHEGTPAPSASTAATASGAAPAAAGQRALVDLAAHPEQCVLGHEGVLLDFGVPAARPLYGLATARAPRGAGASSEAAALEAVEHDGATWDRISTRAITLHFAGPSELGETLDDAGHPEVYVDVRIRSLGARRLTIALNGKLLGTIALPKGETVVRGLHGSGDALSPGTNELTLRLGGTSKAPDAVAEIDWLRVGSVPDAAYAAPTYDTVATETLAGVPRRAIALRAPAFVRCTTAIPKGATFEAQLGLAGKGSGDVEVRVLRDAAAPLSIGKVHLASGSPWTPISMKLPDDAHGLYAVEVITREASPAARVLVADAKLLAPEPVKTPRAKAARGVLVVVLGQTPPSSLALSGGPVATPELAALASTGLVFDDHRASSTWAAAAVGSMLTGKRPAEHGAQGDGSRLADGVTTIADAAKQAGVATAMFTANPTTSAAFGFGRGWETFASFFPGSEGGSTKVMEEAAAWIAAHASERFLVVVHARGGHPPWELSAERLKALAPESYTGPIEPGAHAAEILSHARHVPPSVRFNDADRKRAWTLHDAAVESHDAALGRLLLALKQAGRDGDTSVIVTGDTGMNTALHVPFGDAEPLDDAALATTLVLHPAGGVAPAHVRAPTSSVDVATTILAELGLPPPESFEGEDLRVATGDDDTRPQLASLGGRRLVAWMGLSWRGGEGREELCLPALDPSCASDQAASHPLASEALRRLLAATTAQPPAPVAPTLDGPTVAALTAWGR